MGYGFKRGGSGVFKNGLNVITNPNAIVTATLDSDPSIAFAGVANERGNAYIEVKKKGSYTLSISGVNVSGCCLSTIPASTDKVIAEKTNAVQNINFVYVGDIPALNVGGYSTNTAYACWAEPANYYSGVSVRRNTGSVPVEITDGTSITISKGSPVAISEGNYWMGVTNGSLNGGTMYHYSAWSYYNHINGTTYYGTRRSGSWTARTYSVNDTIIESGEYTIPEGIRSVTVFVCGGGGSGSAVYSDRQGGSGGGGGYCNRKIISVIPNQKAQIVIGAGGEAVSAEFENNRNGNDGRTTEFRCNGDSVSAAGGQGGLAAYQSYKDSPRGGGNGGSGGGAGAWAHDPSSGISYYAKAGAGGSNGASGGNSTSGGRVLIGGNGQGASVVVFNGVAYAGGGGGGYGGSTSSYYASGGNGGGGHGGKDKNTRSQRYDGGAGTDGLGGGGGGSAAVADGTEKGFSCLSGRGGSGACVIYAAS